MSVTTSRCGSLQHCATRRGCVIPHNAIAFPLAQKSAMAGIDFRLSPHDMWAVGLERSRPAFPRHFAQVLHLAR
jgi:hypothetical protein